MSTRNTISGILLAGIFVMAGFSACSEDKEAPQRAVSEKGPDAAVSEALSEVHGVASTDMSKLQVDGTVAVVVKGGSLFEGGNVTKDALEAVQKFGSALPYKTVVVRIDEKLVDRYGRESLEPLFSLTFHREDIDKMNFANLIGWNILNFAEVEAVSPLAPQIARQECEPGSDNAKYADAFCAVATAN